MPNLDRELLARFGREPLALALEYMDRFPKRTGAKDESSARARAFVLGALGKKAHALEGEFVWNHFTCGYFKRADGLAIIPIWGDLGPMRAFWPWVWYEDLADVAEAAAKDDDVKAVLYHIDSPGGYVTGLAECAAAVETAAQKKPTAAFANDYATSAAFWIGCAPGRISAPTTGIVSSIGAMCLHEDISGMLEDMGVKIEVFRSKPRKAETNPFEPLTPVARQQIQSELAVCDNDFNTAIARLRSVDPIAIEATQAACMTAKAALDGRFIDAIESFDQACAAVLARATAKPAVAPPAPAAKGKAKTKEPARGTAAQARGVGAQARRASNPKPTRPRAAATSRSLSMDPTTLPPEEQIARYDEIVALIAEEPADDNGKIGQFVQIVAIVNRDAAAAEPAADPPAEPAAAPPAANASAWTAAQLNSAEAKAHPAAALAAQAAGTPFASFKALAPHLGKGGNLNARMTEQPSARRLGGDAPNPRATGDKVVAMPTPADSYARRAKAMQGGKN